MLWLTSLNEPVVPVYVVVGGYFTSIINETRPTLRYLSQGFLELKFYTKHAVQNCRLQKSGVLTSTLSANPVN